MTREREIISKLVTVCLSLELDLQVAYTVLKALKATDPSLPIQEALNGQHRQQKLVPERRAHYQALLDKLEQDKALDLLATLPQQKYEN